MTGRQTRTRQKYKDSCKHCAGAKVKCSKDKPICTRCTERNLTCSYGLSHRYGRLPAATKLRNMAGDEHHQPSTTPSSPRALLPCHSVASSPSTDGGDFQYSWIDAASPGLTMSVGSPNIYNGCMDFGYDQTIPQHFVHTDFNGITSSMAPWPTQEFQAATPPTPDLALSVGSPAGALDFPQCLDATSRTHEARDHSRSVSSVASFPSGFEYQAAGFSPTPRTAFGTPPETPCQAFPSNNTSTAFSTQHNCLSLASAMLMTLRHSLVPAEATSRKTIDQVLRIAECECFSRDDHTRLFIVLIGLEIMARYSWTIQEESTETVLEDLQVVVKLIDRLLRRLRESTHPSSKSTSSSSSGNCYAPDLTKTISTAVFTQLEADLRENLRGISNQAMDVLRRV